jgi:transcriptional regulator
MIDANISVTTKCSVPLLAKRRMTKIKPARRTMDFGMSFLVSVAQAKALSDRSADGLAR